MEDINKLGGKIKKLREDSGLSQGQLSLYLGVDQSLISRIEKNERQPPVEMIEKISTLFGYPSIDFESDEQCIPSLQFAFRANEINSEDFEAIASINRIALNLREMKKILGGAQNERKDSTKL